MEKNYKKELTRFESKNYYAIVCLPFLLLGVSLLYFTKSARHSSFIGLNQVDIMQIWINESVYNQKISVQLLEAVSSFEKGIYYFFFASCFLGVAWVASRQRKMFRHIVEILKEHDEWTDV